MSTNEAAERLREFLAEISNDQPSDALRDLADALLYERSTGAAPLDVERLRRVLDHFDVVDYHHNLNGVTLADPATAIAAEYARLSDPDKCSIEGCEELPEDHYHPPTIDVDRLAVAVYDAFSPHVVMTDPEWHGEIARRIVASLHPSPR